MNQSPVTLSTVCPLDCPDHCSLDVTVEDGQVVTIEGSRERNPATSGYICTKVRHMARHAFGDERILHPCVREGAKGEGVFERASWEEVLDIIAARMRDAVERHGGEAILPLSYGGSNGHVTQDTADARLFRRLGASRLLRTVCAVPASRAATGVYGKMSGVALEDYRAAKLILVWGANPAATGIHLVEHIRAAQRAGARLVVVDPRRTPLAKQADLHIAPRPGTDLPLALAVHRWLFQNDEVDVDFIAEHTTGVDGLRAAAEVWTVERAARECEVPAEEIETLARWYAGTSPAVLRCGWGMERNRNGGAAITAVIALPAVAGKFGVRGGGFTLTNSRAFGLDALNACRAEEPSTREINMNLLGRTLLEVDDPPVDVLFVYNANPLATVPNQEAVRRGLARDDLFTVVFDQVMTDTARYADVVLPATTFLEHLELRAGYGVMVAQVGEPVMDPVGEARPNVEVFADLIRRLELDEEGDPETSRAVLDAVLGAHPEQGRLREEIASRGWAAPAHGTHPVQFVDVFPLTDDGKVHLHPDELAAECADGLYQYQCDPGTDAFPLALISPATHRTISSTFGQLVKRFPLGLHPDDAIARGIADGDRVRAWNDYGEVICRAHVDPDLRPGVVCMHKGAWQRHTENGNTSNALSPDTLCEIGGGACFNDARIQVEVLPR